MARTSSKSRKRPKKATKTAWTLTPQRRNELWGVLLLASSVLILVSLVTYDPNDLAFFSSNPNPVTQNLCGVVGAWIAGLLRAGIGIASYTLPLLGVLWAFARFNGQTPHRSVFKWISTIIFCLAGSSFLSLLWVRVPDIRIEQGGLFGLVIGDQLQLYFGWFGAVIVLLTVSVLCLILTTELAIWPVLTVVAQWLMKPVQWLAEKVKTEWAARQSEEPAPAKATSAVKKPTPAKATAKQPEPEAKPKRSLFGKKDKIVEEKAAEPEAPKKPVLIKEPPAPKAAPKPEPKPAVQKSEPVKAPVEPLPAAKPTPSKEAVAAAVSVPEDEQEAEVSLPPFQLPPLDLLSVGGAGSSLSKDWVQESAQLLEQTLREFNIESTVAEVELGPVITRYEVEPAAGVKIQRITALADDLALALKASSVRVTPPIPGKGRIGIEVPNPSSAKVCLRDVIETQEFQDAESPLTLAMGTDAAGHPLLADLSEMPHMLIAGATGAGKTVCMNAIISSILFRATPEQVRFMMVDPKMVELTSFNELPHLLMPVITEPKKVPAALAWMVEEMENRYRMFAKLGVRNIKTYHEREAAEDLPMADLPKNLPYLVVIIDELADLMMVAQADIEKLIARLAQMSRAVGIHMILATQRPSVDVLTGVIKANFPARVCFQVASRIDSRTVLDSMGAEKLIGKGDLLYLQPSTSRLIRAQGAFVSDQEINAVTKFLKDQRKPKYTVKLPEEDEEETRGGNGPVQTKDVLYDEALRVIVESGQASVSFLQRRMRLGYGRAARIIDMMEEDGVIGPARGAKPREVLIDSIPGEEPDLEEALEEVEEADTI